MLDKKAKIRAFIYSGVALIGAIAICGGAWWLVVVSNSANDPRTQLQMVFTSQYERAQINQTYSMMYLAGIAAIVGGTIAIAVGISLLVIKIVRKNSSTIGIG